MRTHLSDEDRATLALFYPAAVIEVQEMADDVELATLIREQGAAVAAFRVQERLSERPQEQIEAVAAVALILLGQARRAAR